MGNIGMIECAEVSLMVMSNSEASFELEGTTYKMRRVALDDYAMGQQFIHDRRMNNVFKACLGKPISDECFALAIANVEKQVITIDDVWNDLEGEMYLLHRALNVGEQKYTLADTKRLKIPRIPLVSIMLWACGIPEKQQDDAAPLESAATVSAS